MADQEIVLRSGARVRVVSDGRTGEVATDCLRGWRYAAVWIDGERCLMGGRVGESIPVDALELLEPEEGAPCGPIT